MTGYEGKRVLVTGAAGSGIGAAVVDALLPTGADVFAMDVQPVLAPVTHAFQHDICDERANRDALDAIGAIDAFFCCSGISSGTPEQILAVNFLAVRSITTMVAGQLRDGGAACLVASVAGQAWRTHLDDIDPLLATPDFAAGAAWSGGRTLEPSAYSFSKMALITWTRRQSRRFGEHGRRINTISPGATVTPMMERTFASAPTARLALERRPRALRRFSLPSEQAAAMLFLNSTAASYVTGVDLLVDGGEHAST
jgi:NAD(P)-dependent dehydrogenase (short-subunit alcohol dehydrogenase family)